MKSKASTYSMFKSNVVQNITFHILRFTFYKINHKNSNGKGMLGLRDNNSRSLVYLAANSYMRSWSPYRNHGI